MWRPRTAGLEQATNATRDASAFYDVLEIDGGEERMTTSTTEPVRPAPPRRSTAVLTGGLHLVALWPYAISGLVAPGWGIVALLGVWALLGLAAVRVHRRWGAVSALVPLVAVVMWFGLLTLGEAVLGWSG